MDSIWGWLCILILPGIWVLIVFNGLINARNQVKLSFSTIDVQLKKRFDLIPNLVETVKAYAAHEKETLDAVITARTRAIQPHSSWQDQQNLQQQASLLLVRAEAYPDLKANNQFLMLQRQLAEVEAQIAAARRGYNASVMDYNNRVEMFPSSLIASIFNFKRRPEFEIAIAERSNPNVRF